MRETKRICLKLDGKWQIAFDNDNIGKNEKWFKKFSTTVEEINVPSVWNEIKPNYVGVAWYRIRFNADDRWKNKTVRLKFHAVSYFAEVWLNNKYVGFHEGGYTPFEFNITDELKFDTENQLVLRVVLPYLTDTANFLEVWQPTSTEAIDGFRLEETPNSKQFYYGNFGGIWQSVELLITEKVWIKDCFVQPDIHEGRIRIDLQIQNHIDNSLKNNLSLTVLEYYEEAEEFSDEEVEKEPVAVSQKTEEIEINSGINKYSFELQIEDFVFWSPDAPFLYNLEVSLDKLDSIVEAFGMREFTVQNNAFYLNGEKIIVKAMLFQPHYPITLAYPPDEKFAEKEIRLAKAAGFNMLRMHIKPPPPITLDFADKLGILIQEEPPIGWIKNSPMMKQRCLREVREMVLRDRSHPSVVLWSMLNETGNFFETKDGAQSVKKELCLEARKWDATRLVTDDSGGVEWTKDPAKYLLPYSTEFIEYYDYHPYKPGPVDDKVFNYFQTTGREGQLNYISEFGFGGLGDLPIVLEKYNEYGNVEYEDKAELKSRLDNFLDGFEKFKLDEIFGSFSEFCRKAQEVQALANRFQIEAMRINPKIDGYCLTQFQDAGMEFGAGVVDAFREPKIIHSYIRPVNDPLHIILWSEKRNFYKNEMAQVEVFIVNETGYEGELQFEFDIENELDEIVFSKKEKLGLKNGIQKIAKKPVQLNLDSGDHKVVAKLLDSGEVIRENNIKISIFEKVLFDSTQELAVLNPRAELKEKLTRFGLNWKAWEPTQPVKTILIPKQADRFDEYPIQQINEILGKVSVGARAIFFEVPLSKDKMNVGNIEIECKESAGCFLGGFHYIRQNPVFKGLPVNCLMNDFYRNIYAQGSILGLEEVPLAGTVITSGILFGADLVSHKYGDGKLIFCQLHILDNLESDPVADIVFCNLLKWIQAD